jgi:uracil-DNA glycosylase
MQQIPAQAQALTQWSPETWPVAGDWQPVVARFLDSEPARRLGRFMRDRLAAGATVYPPQPFRALALTPLSAVKVVILGQDPYHGPGQAQGLAFSVASGMALPPSLRNIRKEIARDALASDPAERFSLTAPSPLHGSLESWAQQGVLLLNTCLTVEQGQPASHAKQGWEVLTDEIVSTIWASQTPVVFMLWGAHAQAKQTLFANAGRDARQSHLVLTANHPSPLSALRPPQPFIGCGHFGLANAFLEKHGRGGVAW